MIVDKVLRAHELALAVDVDLVVRHPFTLLTGPGLDLLRPLLQGRGVDKLVLADAQEEIAVLVVGGDLFRRHGVHF
jgi:hypothetical protein